MSTRVSRATLAGLVFASSLAAVELGHAERADPGRLLTLRSGAASAVATDLGGTAREGRVARTLAGDRHAVIDRVQIGSRRATQPVAWGDRLALGMVDGLFVRAPDGTSRTLSLGPIDVRPVVLPSGELLVALRDARVFLISPDLTVRAQTRLTGAARPSPLVLPDGSTVLVTIDRTFVRLDADLQIVFRAALPSGSAGLTQPPAFLAPDRLILAAVDRIAVFDLTGQLLSSVDVGDRIAAAPVVASDGTIHVLLTGGHIAVLDHARSVRTRIPLGGRVLDQGAVLARDDDGSYRVAVATLGVLAIDAEGTTLWTTSTDAPFHGPLAIDAAHRTLAFDRRGRLGVISPSGELLERVELGGISHGFPLVAADGTLWTSTDASELVHVGPVAMSEVHMPDFPAPDARGEGGEVRDVGVARPERGP